MSVLPRRSYYRERIALTAAILLLCSAMALYVIFGDDGSPGSSGDPVRAAAPVTTDDSPADPEPLAGRPSEGPPARGFVTPALAQEPAIPTPAPAAEKDPLPRPVSRPAVAARAVGGAEPNPLEIARSLAAERRWSEAIAIYDRLHSAQPELRPLAVERARVIAWSGASAAGALALGDALARGREDADLRLEQARFFWWGAELAPADSIVGIVLELRPADAAADSLRTQIRMAAEPDVALAQRWVQSRPGALEHLLLGRALSRADRNAEAVAPYRTALRLGVHSDSVALEAAAIAASADSLDAAAEALERYLHAQPRDAAVRLRLARIYAWTDRPDRARREYGILLRNANDPEVRFELAQMEFRAGGTTAAEVELRGVLREAPSHGAALKLLGDLARLRGDWQRALAYYDDAVAVDPRLADLADAAGNDEAIHPAPPRLGPASEWRFDLDAFGDSEGFRWLASRGTYLWGSSRRHLGVAVERNDFEGADPSGTPRSGSGLGAELTASLGLTPTLTLSGRAGARSLEGDFRLPTWGAEAHLAPQPGRSLVLGYQRQPAVRRASTLAALHAEARSDLVQLTAAQPLLGIDLWSRLEVERFSSDLGETRRMAGTLAAARLFGTSWIGSAVVSGLASDGPSPVLAEWGPLYWSPEHYASATVGLAYAATASERWRLSARAAPGYVWVRERDGPDRRFGDDHLPVLGLSGEAAYSLGRWRLGAGADWNGALRSGYRAAALRLQLSQPLGGR